MAHPFAAGSTRKQRIVCHLSSLFVLVLICVLPAFAEQPNPADNLSLEAIVEQLKKNESALSAVSVTLDHSRYMLSFFGEGEKRPVEGLFVGRWSYDSKGRVRYDGLVEETSFRGEQVKLTTLAFDGQVARRLESRRIGSFVEASFYSHVIHYGIDPREVTVAYHRQPLSKALAEKGEQVIESVDLNGKLVLLAKSTPVTSDEGRQWHGRYWVDPKLGMSVVRRSSLTRDGPDDDWHEYHYIECSGYEQVGNDVWLPTKYVCEHLEKPAEEGAKPEVAWRYEGTASHWRIEESFDDALFAFDFDDDVEVSDHRIEAQLTSSQVDNNMELAEEEETDQAEEAAEASETETSVVEKNERKPLYDPQADPNIVIEATARAKRDGKHVIVKFGGNWCGWCYLLHDFLHHDKALATLLEENYELVLVDVNSNRELFLSYGEDNQEHGFPFLTVLDGDGNVLVNQNTADLEEDQSYNTAEITRFLSKWQPEWRDARKLLAEGKARAKEENKRVLVHLGAPWCGWCHRLDAFLARHANRLGKDFVDVKIDTDRMRHGQEIAAKLRGTNVGGIPWFAILDAEGNTLATSDGPNGNVGFPVSKEAVGHFVQILQEHTHQMTDADLDTIRQDLEGAASAN